MTARKGRFYFDRDLSWLSYNHALLEEAQDRSRPLFARIRLLSKFAETLEDYFKYRVYAIRSLLKVEKKQLKRNISDELGETLEQIVKTVESYHDSFQEIFQDQILEELERTGIHLYLGQKKIMEMHQDEVGKIFTKQVRPLLRTIIITQSQQLPGLSNGLLYFACTLRRKEGDSHQSVFATVNIPTNLLPRFFELSPDNDQAYIVSLDAVIKEHLGHIFPDYEVLTAHTVKWYKYMELVLDDDYSGKIASRIKKHLERKRAEHTQRFLFDRQMPEPLLAYFRRAAELSEEDLVSTWQYLNFSDFANLPNPKDDRMLPVEIPELYHPAIKANGNIFGTVRHQDILLQHPPHDFSQSMPFFQQAATDPQVIAIRVSLNRFIPESMIANALASAARNGKRVTVFAQTKARPDQSHDFQWANEMQRIGVKVIYSIPGYRVPGKLALIERMVEGGIELFGYLGAGSFNPLSQDQGFGLMTANGEICTDLSRLFDFLARRKATPYLNRLLVSQINMLERFKGGIHQEIRAVKTGKKGHIILRLNSLEDQDLIDWLYRASTSGVKVDLIIRGICCLIPGMEGKSENIRVIRPIDGFKETTRAYWFANAASSEQLHIGSADWMERNQINRIEFAVPILSPDMKAEILQLLQYEIEDTEDSRLLSQDNTNLPIPRNGQWAAKLFYNFLKRKSVS